MNLSDEIENELLDYIEDEYKDRPVRYKHKVFETKKKLLAKMIVEQLISYEIDESFSDATESDIY